MLLQDFPLAPLLVNSRASLAFKIGGMHAAQSRRPWCNITLEQFQGLLLNHWKVLLVFSGLNRACKLLYVSPFSGHYFLCAFCTMYEFAPCNLQCNCMSFAPCMNSCFCRSLAQLQFLNNCQGPELSIASSHFSVVMCCFGLL